MRHWPGDRPNQTAARRAVPRGGASAYACSDATWRCATKAASDCPLVMVSPRTALVLPTVLIAVLLVGCDSWGSDPKIDEDIKSFIEAESLPEAQRPEIDFEDAEAGITVFRVDFGPGCDCPSGCFYSTAYGLRFRDRIGWMSVEREFCLEDTVRVSGDHFDPQPRDSTLFSADVRNRLREAVTTDEANDVQAPVYEVFLNMLAKDEDTPVRALLDLARLLQESYRPSVGYALLENPTVRSERSVLEVLASLPDSGGYEGVRERAQDLLGQFSNPASGVGRARQDSVRLSTVSKMSEAMEHCRSPALTGRGSSSRTACRNRSLESTGENRLL